MASRYRTKSFELGRIPASDLEPPEEDLVRTAKEIKESLRKDFPYMTDDAFNSSFSKIISKGQIPDPERYLKNYYTHRSGSSLPYEEFKKQFKGYGGNQVIHRGISPEWESSGYYQDLRSQVSNFIKDERGSIGFEPPDDVKENLKKMEKSSENADLEKYAKHLEEPVITSKSTIKSLYPISGEHPVSPVLSVEDKIRINQEKAAIMAGKAKFDEIQKIKELEKMPQEAVKTRKVQPVRQEFKEAWANIFDEPFPTDEERRYFTDQEYEKHRKKAVYIQGKIKPKDPLKVREANKLRAQEPGYKADMKKYRQANPHITKNSNAVRNSIKQKSRELGRVINVSEKFPNWKELHKQYPYYSEEGFLKFLNHHINRGSGPLPAPEKYLKKELGKMGKGAVSTLKDYMGFGGSKLLRSLGPIAKLAGPALIAYTALNDSPAEAAVQTGEMFLPPGMDFGEKLGPPKGSEDYLIEHPWERPKKKGVLDLENKLM